jgi:hypothetical protein
MNTNLLHDIQALYDKYPELLHQSVEFADGGNAIIKHLPRETNEKKSCIAPTERPSFIKGPSTKIRVARSGIHGYGVFAEEGIAEGELIEEAKLLRLALRRKYIHDKVLVDYLWANKSCTCDECQQHGFVNFLALGFGSLYNHSDHPNTIKHLDFAAELITITAGRQIHPGEEIFVTYGEKYWLIREFWDEMKKKKFTEIQT